MFKKNTPAPSTVSVKIPGKLYIAGEYAVLEKDQPAILIAVDQYLNVEMSFSDNDYSQLSTDQRTLAPIQAHKEAADWLLSSKQTDDVKRLWQDWQYVLTAIDTCHDLLPLYNLKASNYKIRILSQLTNEEGHKYGFGSSGAVTVAVIQALLKLHGLETNEKTIYFKLAALSLLRLGSRGSFGDIASNIFQGWLYYVAPDRNNLLEKLSQGWTTAQFLTESSVWEGLVIEALDVSPELQLLIGWTQSPASTENLVARVQEKAKMNPQAYNDFLSGAKYTVNLMKHALENSHWDIFFQQVVRYRQLLQALSQAYHLTIETPSLKKLIEISQESDFYAKSSGAGGGDCGLAFGLDSDKLHIIQKQWAQAGIQPLDVKITFGPEPKYK